jgi:hypothetical protein
MAYNSKLVGYVILRTAVPQISFTLHIYHRGITNKFTLIYDMNFVTSPFRTTLRGMALLRALEDKTFSPWSLFFCFAGLSLHQIAR